MIYISVDLSIIFIRPQRIIISNLMSQQELSSYPYFFLILFSPPSIISSNDLPFTRKQELVHFYTIRSWFFYMIYISVELSIIFYPPPPDNYFESCVATGTFFISVFLSYIILPPSIISSNVFASEISIEHKWKHYNYITVQ